MKHIILSATAVLTLCGSLAFAQQPSAPAASTPPPLHRHHHHHDAHRQAARLSRKLNLTPEQTSKLEPIFASRDQKMKDLRANTSLTAEDRKTQKHLIHKGTQEQMASVLTPDQLQQAHALRHEHHRNGQKPQGV